MSVEDSVRTIIAKVHGHLHRIEEQVEVVQTAALALRAEGCMETASVEDTLGTVVNATRKALRKARKRVDELHERLQEPTATDQGRA